MLWLFAILTASGAEVGWANLGDRAGEAWAERHATAVRARMEGHRAARRHVPLGPTALGLQAQVGDVAGRQTMAWVDVPLTLGARSRRALAAHAEAVGAEGEARRAAWLDATVDLFAEAWRTAVLVEHLHHWADEVAAQLARYEEAAGQGLIARIDVEDLRAELGAVQVEVAEAEAAARRSRGRLEAVLGLEVSVLPVGMQVAENPWRSVVARLDDHPMLRALDMEAEHLRRARHAAGWPAPTAQVGVLEMPTARLGLVGVTVPLRTEGALERRILRGEEEALRLDTARTRQELVRSLETEALVWEADRDRLERVQREVLGPLAAREARLREAFEDGLVPADRWVRARRDHHEAEHAVIEAQASLWGSSLRAAVLLSTLEER